jgi:hypothetical protein
MLRAQAPGQLVTRLVPSPTAAGLTLPPPKPPGLDVPVPTPFGSLPAALPALTHLRAASIRDADVSGLTGLRCLALRTANKCRALKGLSGLTALEDLRLACALPLAQPSDLAPLRALTRLSMVAVLPARALASHPFAARLRRLELQAAGVLENDLWGGGGGGRGTGGAGAAAALAALARDAPLLERLRIRGDDLFPVDFPSDAAGAPLGPGIAWPSLAHLQVTPWAAVLLAGCTFPRLSRLVASVGNRGKVPKDRLQAAVAALAAKTRDHVALRLGSTGHHMYDLAAATAVPGLRHLSCTRAFHCRGLFGFAPPRDWARLAPSLVSLELSGPLEDCLIPLGALSGLTRLTLDVDDDDAEDDLFQTSAARALAGMPRLAHARLSSRARHTVFWGLPAVAAELARCPALRLLEVDRPNDVLWRYAVGLIKRHEVDLVANPRIANPRVPRPSPAWPPFAEALRAGGCRAAVRPGPDSTAMFSEEFDVEI